MIQVIKKAAADKPAKPSPDFPLFPHATKRWAKKIRGRLHYFGPWDNPDAALKKYLRQRDDLYAGRIPRGTEEDGLTVRDLANRFMTSKRHLLDIREIAQRTFDDYYATCERIVTVFGRSRLISNLVAEDFETLREVVAKNWGPIAVGNEIQRVRSVFKYAYDASLIDRPVRFGPRFKRPSKKVLREARAEKGARMFEASEIRKLLDAAGTQLKGMILLGVNCGFGNSDVANLPLQAIDLERGWANYPRPKTGVARRCPLWRETIEALHVAMKRRPAPKAAEHANLVFITKYGLPWAKDTPDSPVSKETAKLLKELKLQRPGLNFYALRHTFETIGGEAKDQVAVDHIMGHARDDMASVYRERISDERLKAVTDHVHAWLFPKELKKDAARKSVVTARKAK